MGVEIALEASSPVTEGDSTTTTATTITTTTTAATNNNYNNLFEYFTVTTSMRVSLINSL
jgi:hypothetical protein